MLFSWPANCQAPDREPVWLSPCWRASSIPGGWRDGVPAPCLRARHKLHGLSWLRRSCGVTRRLPFKETLQSDEPCVLPIRHSHDMLRAGNIGPRESDLRAPWVTLHKATHNDIEVLLLECSQSLMVGEV